MQNQVVYEFEKNATEKVQVQFNNFKGTDLIDIRVYYNTDDEKFEWRPTKKGISVRVDLIPELLKGLNRANELL